MNQNNNGGNKNNRSRGTLGILSIIIWALVITVLMNMLFSSFRSSNTEEVPYSTFRQWVTEGKVARVKLESNKFTFTLVADEEAAKAAQSDDPWAQMTAERTAKKLYVTAPLNDAQLLTLMEEHGVEEYGTELKEESSYLMELILSYVVPMALMVGLLIVLFRFMSSKMGGGVGGIGGVGKANANVYV